MYCNIVIPPDGNPANHTSVYNALKVFRVHLQSMGSLFDLFIGRDMGVAQMSACQVQLIFHKKLSKDNEK